MKIQRGFADPSAYREGCVSIGNFDGVHRGHQRMIAALVRQAGRLERPAVVITFDPHPMQLLAPDHAPPRLSTPEQKAERLARSGVDCLIVYPTDSDLLNLSPREFFDRIVLGELHAGGMVEGPNFCFGKDRAGTVETLREYCGEAGIPLEVVEAVTLDGVLISSSVIRSAIAGGELSRAVEMLGHPYRLRGIVAGGAGRGGQLGYPTANLTEIATLLPADGVYAGLGHVAEESYAAAVHIGANPTFREDRRKVEVHLVGYSGKKLYGEALSVDLLDRVRPTMTFPDGAALQEQLARDIDAATRVVRRYASV